jgi:hypothetical protein
MYKNLKYLFICSLFFVACSEDIEEDTSGVESEVPVTAGTANFSKYVALGNSLTAGYADGALFIEGQKNSYPKLLSDQFALVGGGTFEIPYMNDNFGGLLIGGFPLPGVGTRLYFNGCAPVNLSATPTTDLASPLVGFYNNMGVPGAKSYHLLAPNYGDPNGLFTLPRTANPYFVRFAQNQTTSILADAMAQIPTFFSLWIGNNDVLGYALSGGVPTSQDPVNGDNITPPNGAPGLGFDGTYTALINTLTSNGAKGVVANIPYVTAVPFFTTVSVNPVAPYKYYLDVDETICSKTYDPSANDIATINTINSKLIGPLSQILTSLGEPDRFKPLSTTKNNPVIIVDESITDFGPQITFAAQNSGDATLVALASYLGNTYGKARQTKSGDYILLTTSSVLGTTNSSLPSQILAQGLGAYGITYPLSDKYALVPSEVLEIKTATDLYNVTIKSLADDKGLAFVDANAALNQVANGGVIFDNFHMTNDFVKGGAFGLDGVHPSARGQAYIANKFIEAINAKYGSTLRKYKAQDFPLSYPAGL